MWKVVRKGSTILAVHTRLDIKIDLGVKASDALVRSFGLPMTLVH